jgi:uridine phosphorylase
MILTEYDNNIKSTFNPDEVENAILDFPKIGISCFSHKIIEKIVEKFSPKQIALITSANGKVPVYKLNYNGKDIALFMSRVGAPACTIGYEEVIAMGLEKLVLFGTCGVLEKEIDDLAIIIPKAAIRDEGTSYHYKEATDEIVVNKKYKDVFELILKEHNYSFVEGKTWTTDAPYRETKEKVIKRKKQGCVCVEMECASMFAVSEFRGKDLFQFFYAADNLDSSKWDQRSLGNDDKLSEKEKVAILALELAIRM